MNFLTTLRLYYIRKIKETLRNPPFLFMSVFTPLMYLVLFAPLLKSFIGMPGFAGGSILNMFLPGVIVTLALFGGLFVGFGMVDEIRQGVIERFRVTPTSRLALLLGSVLRDVTNVVVQTLIITVMAIPFGLTLHWGGFMVILLILGMITAILATCSYVLALKLKSEDALAPITQGVSLPLMLLAGVLLPMNIAPHWLQVAAHFNPLYYAVEASRSLINGVWNVAVVYEAFAVITPLLALVFWWAVRSYRTAVG